MQKTKISKKPNLTTSPGNSDYLLWALLGLLTITPIFFGSNTPIAWSLMSLFVGACMAFWVFLAIKNQSKIDISLEHVRFVAIPFLLVVTWAAIQSLPFNIHPIWGMAQKALNTQMSPLATFDFAKTMESFMKFLAYGMVFWLALQLGRNRDYAKRIFLAIIIIGVLCALYGLVLNFYDLQKILWVDKKSYTDSMTSTFFNRNSYATYVGIGIITTLALFLSETSKNFKNFNDNPYFLNLINSLTKNGLFFLSLLTLLFATLIMTNSRAGITSSIIGAISFLLLFSLASSSKKQKATMAIFAILLVFTFFLLFNLTGELLSYRFSWIERDFAVRNNIYRVTINAINDFYISGSGLGTFEDAFLLYRDSLFPKSFSARIDHAHNTYLETILEIGIPAFSLFFISIFSAILICFKGLLSRKRGAIFPAVGVATSILIWAHAFFDFSIEMPAITITYAIIMGVGCAQSWSSKKALSSNNSASKAWHICAITIASVSAVLLICLGSYFSYTNISYNASARGVFLLKSNKIKTFEELESLVAEQKAAVDRAKDGTKLQDLGFSQVALSRNYGYFSDEGQALLKSAISNLDKGLARSPLNTYSWVRLGYAQLIAQGPSKEAGESLYMSVITSPYNYQIIYYRLTLLLSLFDYLDKGQQDIVKQQIRIVLDWNEKKLLELGKSDEVIQSIIDSAIY